MNERAQFGSEHTANAAYDELIEAGIPEYLLAIAYWPNRRVPYVLYVGPSF